MKNELELYAAFVHGAVAFGNALGLIFNARRKQWAWCLVHAVGVAVHVKATVAHARELP